MDHGDLFTPAKKYFTVAPVLLFLCSTHYTHYDIPTFCINIAALMINILPKINFKSLEDEEYNKSK